MNPPKKGMGPKVGPTKSTKSICSVILPLSEKINLVIPGYTNSLPIIFNPSVHSKNQDYLLLILHVFSSKYHRIYSLNYLDLKYKIEDQFFFV